MKFVMFHHHKPSINIKLSQVTKIHKTRGGGSKKAPSNLTILTKEGSYKQPNQPRENGNDLSSFALSGSCRMTTSFRHLPYRVAAA
jgi:hypothetical protein